MAILAAASTVAVLAPWPVLLVGLLVCVLAAGFFSFAETCLTSLSESKVHALMAAQGRRAAILELWLNEPHRILTTILIGSNIASVLAPVLMAELMRSMLGEDRVAVAIAWATATVSFLLLVFGEITPKNLARQLPQRHAVAVMIGLRFFHVALIPVTWFFVAIARGVVKLVRGEKDGGADVSEAEIQAMVDLGQREGILGPRKAAHLRAVFDLSDRQVREIMVARPEIDALDIAMDPAELVRSVDSFGHSRVPMYRGSVDHVVGILHAKDLLHLLASGGVSLSRRQIQALLRQPDFVPETMRLETLLAFFRQSRQHLVVVLDEFGGTAGIATLEDVLEELVGDIRDEHDVEDETPGLAPAGPGRWTAPGRLPLSVLERALDLQASREGGYETLAGLLMDVAGRVPSEGSQLRYGGYRFEVLTGDERTVGLVRIERDDPKA